MTARRSRSRKEISVTNAANAALAAPSGRDLRAFTCGGRDFRLPSGEGGLVLSLRLLVLLRRRGGMIVISDEQSFSDSVSGGTRGHPTLALSAL